MTMQKWGGLASFLLPAGFLVAPLIYQVGDLRNPLDLLGYILADFLYGPLWAIWQGIILWQNGSTAASVPSAVI